MTSDLKSVTSDEIDLGSDTDVPCTAVMGAMKSYMFENVMAATMYH